MPQEPSIQIDEEDGMFVKEISLLGGVNLLNDPRTIRDDECVMTKNCYPVTPGVMAKRPGLGWQAYVSLSGLTSIGNVIAPTSQGFPLAAASPSFLCNYDVLFVWYDPVGNNNNTEPALIIGAVDLNGTVATGITIARSLVGGGNFPQPSPVLLRPWIFSFGTTQYVLLGSSVYPMPGVQVSNASNNPPVNANYTQTVNGVTIQPFAWTGVNGTPVQDVFPRIGCAYRSRVAWGNLGPGYERYIIMSDNFNPTRIAVGNEDPLAVNGRAFQVGRAGDVIIGMVEIMLTSIGGPPASALLVMCQNSSYLITGEPNQCSDNQALTPITGNMQVGQTSFNCGCASPWTIARTPYGIIWVGPDDVWMFQTGQGPKRIGTKIRPAILRNPPSMMYKMTAAYSNGIYRFMCAGDGQSPADGDALQDQWFIDLRNGPPQGDVGEDAPAQSARWFGPQQFIGEFAISIAPQGPIVGTRVFFQDTRPGKDANVLYGIEKGVLNNQAFPGFGPFSIVSYDAGTDHDVVYNPADISTTGAPFQQYEQNGSLPGLDYHVEIYTKRYNFETTRQQKVFDSLDLAIGNNQTFQLAVDVVCDDGLVLTTLTKDILPPNDFVLGVSALGSQVLSNASQALTVRDTTRASIGLTHQFHIYETIGIDIQSDADIFTFSVAFTLFLASIPHGIYSNLFALVNAIATAMTTANSANTYSNASGSTPGWMQITSTGPAWQIDFTVNGTAAQRALTRKLGAMMAWDTSQNTTAVTHASEQTVTAGANNPPWGIVNPLFTIEDLTVRGFIIPRLPT